MACNTHLSVVAAIPLLFLLLLETPSGVRGSVGVCYGRLGDDLPPPGEVVDLYKSQNITSMRIYEPDDSVLQALSGSNIELAMGVPGHLLQTMAENPVAADEWIQRNVLSYWPDVKFRYIVVGNEVIPMKGVEEYVLPAMQNIYNAISSSSYLQDQIKVSTSVKFDVLGKSYPPSDGEFSTDAMPFMGPIVKFLGDTEAPLMANVYPYFSYVEDPEHIQLSYALFTSPGIVVQDGEYGYQNLFDAMVDALYSAVEKVEETPYVDGSNLSSAATENNVSRNNVRRNKVRLTVTETGWPGGGRKRPRSIDNTGEHAFNSNLASVVGSGTAPERQVGERKQSRVGDENVETIDIARIYNSNLIWHVESRGTPKRPGMAVETYIFAMFNENLKEPQGIENYWGLFYPNKQPIYKICF